jgi:hypothetical protein
MPVKEIVPPQAIVSAAGLYDLVLLRDSDCDPPSCQGFLSRAFGSDEEVWRDQSPVYGNYDATWSGGKVAVLLESSEDEYVSPKQLAVMEKALQQWSRKEARLLVCHTVDGRHDDCWKMGQGMAYGVEAALDHLVAKPSHG